MSSSKSKKNKKPHGQVRQSQVVTTFGPGSLFDLPNHSVIVGGLEYWTKGDEIQEPRLVAKLKDLLQVDNLALYAPPPDSDDPVSPQKTGITSWQFPEWFITQGALATESGRSTRSRRLIPRSSLTKGKFIDHNKKPQPVVPVRFVRACRKGHIGDINWFDFVHRGDNGCRRDLWIDERGTSGDLSEVWVRCECKAERQMIESTKSELRALGRCDGWMPWLGPRIRELCDEQNRMLVRTASNAYFPQTMSVISLPDRDEAVAIAVAQVWEHYLQYVEDLDDLVKERKRKPPVAEALEGLSDEEAFAEIQRRKQNRTAGTDKSVKQAEFETLMACKEEIGTDKPDGDFYARSFARQHWDHPWMKSVECIVLVHRLREVIATVGFTRFESSSPDVEGELEIGVTRAPLARELSWLPAIENRGEGVFIQFKKDSIDRWLQKPAVKQRGQQLDAGFECWKKDHKNSKRQFCGMSYLLLHSLSHLLVTAVSLECGYPASSIRERIYAGSYGYGILLYTGSPDAEGTMGGIVQAGRQIARHLKSAIDLGRLCSNDPVCAQHAPENQHECRFLHGAACHGCLLIAETSCEQHNDFLDRALVISTVDSIGAEFFGENEA
ncbi:MAG: DrmB family protein [Isosphaeraceae bacterium]